MMSDLKKDGSGNFYLNSETLAKFVESRKHIPFGEAESFYDEPTRGIATAFLITPRLALTARHCVCVAETADLDKETVKNTHLVFGFILENAQHNILKIEKKNAYKFKVIEHSDMNSDWALLKLDRDVEGRVPLATNFVANTVLKTKIYMLGHPSGLPMKFTYGAEIKRNANQYFGADLDAFAGNSGSPVFDKTHQYVIGILVTGGTDYDWTSNYQNTGNIRSYAYHIKKAAGYESVQKLNRMKLVKHYMRAQQGGSEAQYELGLAYYKIDKQKGIKWLKKAAFQGHGLSYYKLRELGECFTCRCNNDMSVSIVIMGETVHFHVEQMDIWKKMQMQSYFVDSFSFARLSQYDKHFLLFIALCNGELDQAESLFNDHQVFFTHCLKSDIFLKLIIERNRKVYIDFFCAERIFF